MARRLAGFAGLFLLGLAAGSPALADDAPHWTYEGTHGPGEWGELAPDYAVCALGRQQSPIDLAPAWAAPVPGLDARYLPSTARAVHNGHTIQIVPEAGGGLVLDGIAYTALQFHFHAPSEHTIGGAPAAFELHLVHADAGGRLLVLGLIYDVGPADPVLAGFWDALPGPETEAPLPGPVDLAALADPGEDFYWYAGSLTTPPCSEGVTWLVAAHHRTLSPAQLEAFTSRVDANARPVQALNGRYPP